MRSIIVAYDAERAIGRNNELLWKFGEQKADMKRFRELTKGTVLVMGRKTLESIGFALPGRRNIVVSSQSDLGINGIEIASSIDQAFEMSGEDDVSVMGGSQIYEQTLSLVDR